MKITRYPQSCLLIENGGRTILIDPGSNFLDSHQKQELDAVEAVLYTHNHSDHLEPDIVAYLADRGVEIYANAESAKTIGNDQVRIVNNGDEFEVAGFRLSAHGLPHCPMPDGGDGPQNTGYLIDGTLFHPGDGKGLEGLEADSVALPIQGPDLSFRDAFDFAAQLKPKVVIPIHYDLMGANPEVFKMFAGEQGLNVPYEIRVLQDGESTEL